MDNFATNSNTQDPLTNILVGALLTFVSLFLIELIKNYLENRSKVRNFRLSIRQEFRIILKNLDKLKNTLDAKNYFDYIILGSIKTNIQNLEEYKKQAIYLSNSDLHEKFIDLGADISSFRSDAEGVQQLYWSEKNRLLNPASMPTSYPPVFNDQSELDRWFHDQKLEKIIELTELKRRIEEILKELA